MNLTTATRDNALTDEEREAFLAEKRVGRLGTNRGDGWWHVTPIWYVWENGCFYLSLGNSRRHLIGRVQVARARSRLANKQEGDGATVMA